MKILIAESIPWANKGEVAIFRGMMKSFDVLGEVHVSLFSQYPEEDQAGYGDSVRVIGVRKERKEDLFRFLRQLSLPAKALLQIAVRGKRLGPERPTKLQALAETDVVIVGHDNCGVKISFESLCIVTAAKLMGKKIVFYSGSFGPFSSLFRRVMAKMAFLQADLITCREPVSYRNVTSLALHKDVLLTADLAFLLEASVINIRGIIGLDIPEGTPVIGINANKLISRYSFPDAKSSDERYKRFTSWMAKTLERVIRAYGCHLILIPHVYGYGQDDDDREVLRNIWSLIDEKRRVSLIEAELPVEILKGIISQVTLFVGARTHSLIGALSSCVPSVALTSSDATHNKANGLLTHLLDAPELLFNVRDSSEEALFTKIDWVWANRERIKAKLKERVPRLCEEARLNGDLLKRVVGGA